MPHRSIDGYRKFLDTVLEADTVGADANDTYWSHVNFGEAAIYFGARVLYQAVAGTDGEEVNRQVKEMIQLFKDQEAKNYKEQTGKDLE